MIVTTYKCDRCGANIENEALQIEAYDIQTHQVVERMKYPRHLCPDCAEVLAKWIVKGETLKDKPKASEGKQMRVALAADTKDLDIGKIKALRDAGWSNKKIADEMGVSDATIRNRLKAAV